MLLNNCIEKAKPNREVGAESYETILAVYSLSSYQ